MGNGELFYMVLLEEKFIKLLLFLGVPAYN